MKANVPGNPSCSRISHDSTRATSPMAEAVSEYWMAMTLASCEKTYCRPPAFRMIEFDFRHFGRRNACDCVIWDIDHRIPPRSFPSGMSVSRARSIFAAAFCYLPPDLYVAFVTAFRPDNSANVCCFSSQA